MHYEMSVIEHRFSLFVEFSSRIECDVLQAYCGFLHTTFYTQKDMEYTLAPELICRLLKGIRKICIDVCSSIIIMNFLYSFAFISCRDF